MPRAMALLVRLIVLVSARLAAPHVRKRWTEEWLAELDAAGKTASGVPLRHALGAFKDAVATRRTVIDDPRAGLTAGLKGDFIHAMRALRRRPGHTAAVVACLSIGLIVSVSTFSILTSVLYGKRIGFSEQDSLRRIFLAYRDADGQPDGGNDMSLSDYDLVRSDAAMAARVAAEGKRRTTASTDDGPIEVIAAFASGNLFSVIGTVPVTGRLLASVDDQSDAPPVAVIGEYFWRNRLGGRSDAIGKSILLGGRDFIVVGVAPTRFHGIQGDVDPMEDDSHGAQVWVPLHFIKTWPRKPQDNAQFLQGVVRLPADSGEAGVTNLFGVAAARISASNPAERAGTIFQLTELGLPPGVTLWQTMALLGAVMSVPIGVLAIGCANVANLQLARAAERARELSVRASLGASRFQLIRLLTVEIGVQAIAAVFLCAVATTTLLKSIAWIFPQPVAIDWRAALLAGGLLLFVLAAAGLAPAWLVTKKSGTAGLRQNERSGGLGHTRLRNGLIVMQVALSLAMLCTSTFIARAVSMVDASVPPVLLSQTTVTIDTAQIGLTPAEARRFADTVLVSAASDQRIDHAALSVRDNIKYRSTESPDRAREADLTSISAQWLDMMRVPVMTGRVFASTETDAAVVSARMAEEIAPNASPLGQVLDIAGFAGTPDRRVRVVGVVADHYASPSSDRPDPMIYLPLPNELGGSFTLRFSGRSRDAAANDFRATVRRLEPRLPWLAMKHAEDEYLSNAGPMLFIALGIGSGGVIALLLATGGLYAVMAYVVQLRRREIGVRLAVGADPLRIVGMILREAMTFIVMGSVAGLVIAVPLTLVFRANAPVKLPAIDPMVFLPTIAALMLAGLIAAIVPAQRAARIDPVKTIRED